MKRRLFIKDRLRLSSRLFTGPTVAEVIKQYWRIIGTPVKPPYWGLGHFYGSELISSHDYLQELMQTNHTKLGQLPVEGWFSRSRIKSRFYSHCSIRNICKTFQNEFSLDFLRFQNPPYDSLSMLYRSPDKTQKAKCKT